MKRALIWLGWAGGIGLLLATAVDTAGVIGRHVGLPVHGSIELIQPAILLAGVAGLLAATWTRSHAKVHLVIDRLGARGRRRAGRFADMSALLFFAGLLVGSAWLQIDMWDSHERSELVGVPWAAMRILTSAGLLAITCLLAWRMVRREP
jgi:TRAP-type C4-dicarboxylate transport system permease small subunit